MATAKKRTRYSVVSIIDKVILKFAQLGEKGWTKGVDARDKYNMGVIATSPKACKFCNQGVVLNILGTTNIDNVEYKKIDRAFNFVTSGVGMINSNDDASMTFERNLFNWVKVREYVANLDKKKKK